MRVRELIEHARQEDVERGQPFSMSTVDSNGDEIGGSSTYASVEEAMRVAEESSEGRIKRWVDPPKEWQPDAIKVSNWYNEEGWNRDS